MQWVGWRQAADQALYGPDGFFRRQGADVAEHFRTSVAVGTTFAAALLRLLAEVDEALGRPDRLDVVDVGAGGGQLLRLLGRAAEPGLRARLRLHAVELTDPPPDLPDDITWSATPPVGISGLLVGNEVLDNVPLDVVVLTAQGPRLLLVDPASGREQPGPPPSEDDLAWLRAWWPLDRAEVGSRAEIGRPRDEVWAGAVGSLAGGVAVAIDYATTAEQRASGALAAGTLTGYRAGRQVAPVPDGSCDLTAHVALDACAAAGRQAGAGATLLTGQRAALRALGLDGRRPPRELAVSDPVGYLHALRRAGEVAELTDAAGLGGFGWLVQVVGVPLPPSLAPLPTGER